MEFGHVGIFIYSFKLAIIVVAIIIAITISINLYKRFINGNRKISEKKECSFEEIEKRKIKNKLIMAMTIAINIIFVLLFPLSLVAAMISPFTFDAPGSNEEFYNWVFFYATISFPVVILISEITSLIFLFILKSYKKALTLSLLPMINIIIVLLMLE